DQVVVDEHARAAGDRVAMDLERVDAVLEDVLDRVRLPWQLARLARRYEAGADPLRDGTAEDEAACLRGRDQRYLALARVVGQRVDRMGQGRRVEQERRDVLENDSGLREVRDVADVFAQVY